MGLTLIDGGSFTSQGLGVKIPLQGSADYFRAQNLTQVATQQTPGRGVIFEWYLDQTAPENAIRWFKTDATNALNLDSVATGGFTYVRSLPPPEPAVGPGTAITNVDPAVVTLPNTYSDGDRVRLYSTTGMNQIAGMEFTISNVGAGGFTLLGLNGALMAGPATAVTARRVSKLMPMEPSFLFITDISQGAQAEIRFSTQHNYVEGMLIHFSVPSSFGMTEIDGLTGKIVSATGTNAPIGSDVYKVVVDIDTSGFSAFSFPLTGALPQARLFATAAPAGQRTQSPPVVPVQTGYNFTEAPFRSGDLFPYMYLAAGAQSPAGSNGDLIEWQAFKYEV